MTWIYACCQTDRSCVSALTVEQRHAAVELDAGVLEQSALWVAEALEKSELLVVNKFGKQEAEGKGLAGSIADALERDLPVLVGVNGLNLSAFIEFAGGMAQQLPPDAEQVAGWCLAACVNQAVLEGSIL